MRSLQQDPDHDDSRQCVKAFFHESRSDFDRAAYESFLTHYLQEVLEYRGVIKASTHPSRSCSHSDLQRVFRELEASPSSTKAVLIQRLSTKYRDFDKDQLSDIVDLTCRTGFLLNARAANDEITTPEPALTWEDDVELSSWIGKQFPKSEWKLNARESRLHPKFTAAFMVRICGLRLYWTNCIADHLYLDRQNKLLHVFHHKACIESRLADLQQRSAVEPGRQSDNL